MRPSWSASKGSNVAAPKQLFANFVTSTLSAAITAADVTMTLSTGQGASWPTITGSDFMYAVLEVGTTREIVKVTAHAAGADAMTIVRGQESTTARAWLAGDKVELRLTAVALTRAEDVASQVVFTGPTALRSYALPDSAQTIYTTASSLTDIVMLYPAIGRVQDDLIATPLVPIRVAKGDWALSRTAGGAETHNLAAFLEAPWRSTSGKGWKLTAFSLVHQITVVDLTSNTFNDLSTVTYANNVANAVADYGGVVTITLPTVVQANPYVTAATLATPAFQNGVAGVNIDWTAVMANTGVYRVYGIVATWTEQF